MNMISRFQNIINECLKITLKPKSIINTTACSWCISLFGLGFHHVAEFKHFSSLSDCSSGEARKFFCRLATHLWPSSQLLWPRKRISYCRLHWSHYLYPDSSLFHTQCPWSSSSAKDLDKVSSIQRVSPLL